MGMSAAQRLAAQRALGALGVVPDAAVVDGRWDFVSPNVAHVERRVKADANCFSVAAASILAKVVRDREMRGAAEHYPPWSFDTNKGYPCPVHKAALQAYGPSVIHRRTWVFMDHYVPWSGIRRVYRPEQPVLFEPAGPVHRTRGPGPNGLSRGPPEATCWLLEQDVGRRALEAGRCSGRRRTPDPTWRGSVVAGEVEDVTLGHEPPRKLVEIGREGRARLDRAAKCRWPAHTLSGSPLPADARRLVHQVETCPAPGLYAQTWPRPLSGAAVVDRRPYLRRPAWR